MTARSTDCGVLGARSYSFDFGPFTIAGSPPGDVPVAYCPRRIVLDQLLVEAADEAGAEVRDGFAVDELVFDADAVVGIRGRDGGSSAVERARVVIGADGAHSRVAKAVGAASYNDRPMLAAAYYSYWSGIPAAQAQWLVRPGHGYGCFPTNDGLTMLLAAWPVAEFRTVKRDFERHYLNAVRDVFGDRLDGARREERVVGGGVANWFRTPHGPGWVLVGDAGYLKDPITAHGITDAFRDAESCVAATPACYPRTNSPPSSATSASRHPPSFWSCSVISSATGRRWMSSSAFSGALARSRSSSSGTGCPPPN